MITATEFAPSAGATTQPVELASGAVNGEHAVTDACYFYTDVRGNSYTFTEYTRLGREFDWSTRRVTQRLGTRLANDEAAMRQAAQLPPDLADTVPFRSVGLDRQVLVETTEGERFLMNNSSVADVSPDKEGSDYSGWMLQPKTKRDFPGVTIGKPWADISRGSVSKVSIRYHQIVDIDGVFALPEQRPNPFEAAAAPSHAEESQPRKSRLSGLLGRLASAPLATYVRASNRFNEYFGDPEAGRDRRQNAVVTIGSLAVGTLVVGAAYVLSKNNPDASHHVMAGFNTGNSALNHAGHLPRHALPGNHAFLPPAHHVPKHAADSYRVKTGDNPWTIARSVLHRRGDPNPSNEQITILDKRITTLNHINPAHLKINRLLKLPEVTSKLKLKNLASGVMRKMTAAE